jgi:peptidase E
MTKYILHGGNTSNKTEDNKKFFFEMTSSLSDNATILCIYFSRPKELWAKLFEQDKINFSSASQQKVFKFVLADDKTYTLVDQLKEADVVYLRGGDTDKLKETLSKVNNLDKLLKNKVVSGSSAGAYVLSRYYYTNNKDEIKKGLGILPIKTFCHYAEEKSDKLKLLKEYGEDLETYAIPEEKFFIIEQ